MNDDDDDRRDPGRARFTQREVFDLLFKNPAARAYTIAAGASLFIIFMVMFLSGSDIGGALVVLFGTTALLLRWTAMPPLMLIVLCYFQLFPFGVPEAGYDNPFQIRETHFRIADAVLVMAVLVYLRSVYRVFGLTHQAMPFEGAIRRKGDNPVRRPVEHIVPGEITWVIGVAGGIVLFGQAAWWLANGLEFAIGDEFTLRWAEERSLSSYRRSPSRGEFTPGQNRFLVLIGALFFGTLLVRLAYGYWQLRMMTAAEGAMILTDTSWAESHRERVRVERWRIWGRQKAAELTKKAEREERNRQAKADTQTAMKGTR